MLIASSRIDETPVIATALAGFVSKKLSYSSMRMCGGEVSVGKRGKGGISLYF